MYTWALSGMSFFTCSTELRHLSNAPALNWSFASVSTTLARAASQCLADALLCSDLFARLHPPVSTSMDAAAAAAVGTANRLNRFMNGTFPETPGPERDL